MFLLHSSVLQLLGPSCFAPRVDSVVRGGELGVAVLLCPSNLMPPQLKCFLWDTLPSLLPLFRVVQILPSSNAIMAPCPSFFG